MSIPGLFRTADGRNHVLIFTLVTSLFLLWAMCNGMIDVMDKHFQDLLHLTKAQSAWVQTAHYLGYFLMALPAGWLAQKLGYKGGIIAGLLLVAAGCLWFIPATGIAQFWAFLVGVCAVSMGLTFLETIANPYTTVLGAPQFAAVRINTAQTFNGVGWILGPLIGSRFFYSSEGAVAAQKTIWIPYAGIAVGVLLLAVVFACVRMPDLGAPVEATIGTPRTEKKLWRRPHFCGAVVAQFLYVAAQAGVFSFFINYVVEETPALSSTSFISWIAGGDRGVRQADGAWFISDAGGAALMSWAFGLFVLGRFTGAALLMRCSAHRLLGIYAALSVVLMVVIVMHLGWLSFAALLLSFFFMSIMFPTIFALGVYDLGSRAKWAASFLVMAIMGGAILPKLMGSIGDQHGMSAGFLVPLVCFAVIALYGFLWPRLSGAKSLVGVTAGNCH